jgi:hypothetical protein
LDNPRPAYIPSEEGLGVLEEGKTTTTTILATLALRLPLHQLSAIIVTPFARREGH